MFVRIGNVSFNSDQIVLVEATAGGTVYIVTIADDGTSRERVGYMLAGRDADAFRHWQREHEYDALAALEQYEREQADRKQRQAETLAFLGG